MHIESKPSAIALCLGLIALMSSLSALAPATSSAEGVRYSWESSAAFERAGLSRLLLPGEKRPGGFSSLLENSSVVRFLKALPLEPVSIPGRGFPTRGIP